MAGSLLLVGIALPTPALDMEAQTVWVAHIGGESWESAVDTALAPDGGAFMIGADDGSSSMAGKPDPGPCAYVAKLRSDGQIEWFRWLGRQTAVSSLAVTPDGGIAVLGEGARRNMVGAPENATEEGLFAVKLGRNGDPQWTAFLTGPGCAPAGLAVDAQGAVYASGNAAPWCKAPVTGPAPEGASALVFKLSPAGVFTWALRLDGRGDDRLSPAALAADSQGNLYAGGYIVWGNRGDQPHPAYNMPGLLDAAWKGGLEDGLLACISNAGKIVWTRLVGGSRGERILALASDPQGLFAGGTTVSTDLDPRPSMPGPGEEGDAFYMRLDRNGKAVWSAFSGMNPRGDACRDLWLAKDNRTVVVVSGGGMALLDARTGARTYAKFWGSLLHGSGAAPPPTAAASTGTEWDLLMTLEPAFELNEKKTPTDRNAALVRIHFEPCPDPYEPNDSLEATCDLRAHPGKWLSELKGEAAVADVDYYDLHADPGSPALEIKIRNIKPEARFFLELFDRTGKSLTLWEGTPDPAKSQLALPSPAPGLYFLLVCVHPRPPNGLNPTRRTTYDLWWDDGVDGGADFEPLITGHKDANTKTPQPPPQDTVRDDPRPPQKDYPFSGEAVATPLKDDFQAPALDATRWIQRLNEQWKSGIGKTVRVAGGSLLIRQDEVDLGGALVSVPIPIRPGCVLRLVKRTKLHAANDKFRGQTAILPSTLADREPWTEPLVRVFYFHYVHRQHNLKCFSFGYTSSPSFEPVWDAWFEEVLIYNPKTGEASYSLNSADPIKTKGAPAKGDAVRIGLGAYGWHVGHEHAVDFIRAEWIEPIDPGLFQRR